MSPVAYVSRHARLFTRGGCWKYGWRMTYDHVEEYTLLMPPISPVRAKSTLTPAPMVRPPTR